MLIVLEDPASDDSDDSASYVDISDIEAEQKQATDSSDSLEASSGRTTLSNSTPPNLYDTKSNTSREAKLKIYSEIGDGRG
jgi:hypothetical protein